MAVPGDWCADGAEAGPALWAEGPLLGQPSSASSTGLGGSQLQGHCPSTGAAPWGT